MKPNWFTNLFRATPKDYRHYDTVAEELSNHLQEPGLRTRAIAEAMGDEAKAKALYIKFRVAQLIEEERATKEVTRRAGPEQKERILREPSTEPVMQITETSPDDRQITLSEPAQNALRANACPFCGSDAPRVYSLQVGYKKTHVWIASKLFWAELSCWHDELYTRLPICEACRMRYLRACRFDDWPLGQLFSFLIFDPNAVLQPKIGYRCGIKYPFLTGNLKPLDKSKW